MSSDERFKQLALFSVIVAEVVITPAAIGGLVYYLARALPSRNFWVLLGALSGLGIAFYRIMLILKNQKKDETQRK